MLQRKFGTHVLQTSATFSEWPGRYESILFVLSTYLHFFSPIANKQILWVFKIQVLCFYLASTKPHFHINFLLNLACLLQGIVLLNSMWKCDPYHGIHFLPFSVQRRKVRDAEEMNQYRIVTLPTLRWSCVSLFIQSGLI